MTNALVLTGIGRFRETTYRNPFKAEIGMVPLWYRLGRPISGAAKRSADLSSLENRPVAVSA
jgi:hypothetical protein